MSAPTPSWRGSTRTYRRRTPPRECAHRFSSGPTRRPRSASATSCAAWPWPRWSVTAQRSSLTSRHRGWWLAPPSPAPNPARLSARPARTRIAARRPPSPVTPAPTGSCWTATRSTGTSKRASSPSGHRVLAVDDHGHAGRYDAQLVLNPDAGADPSCTRPCARHPAPARTRYALLRAEFRDWSEPRRPTPARARRVVVTFGGSTREPVRARACRTGRGAGTAGDPAAGRDRQPPRVALRAQRGAICHTPLRSPSTCGTWRAAGRCDLAVTAAGGTIGGARAGGDPGDRDHCGRQPGAGCESPRRGGRGRRSGPAHQPRRGCDRRAPSQRSPATLPSAERWPGADRSSWTARARCACSTR